MSNATMQRNRRDGKQTGPIRPGWVSVSGQEGAGSNPLAEAGEASASVMTPPFPAVREPRDGLHTLGCLPHSDGGWLTSVP